MDINPGWDKPFPIVPSDAVDAVRPFRALYVGGIGDVTVVLLDGATCLFSAVPVGSIIPVQGKRVNATATTATLMVGFSMI